MAWALTIGLVCGAGEYFLLARFTKALLAGGGEAFVYLLLKLLLLAAALFAVYFIDSGQLLWAATGIAAPLVLLPTLRFALARLRGGAR